MFDDEERETFRDRIEREFPDARLSVVTNTEQSLIIDDIYGENGFTYITLDTYGIHMPDEHIDTFVALNVSHELAEQLFHYMFKQENEHKKVPYLDHVGRDIDLSRNGRAKIEADYNAGRGFFSDVRHYKEAEFEIDGLPNFGTSMLSEFQDAVNEDKVAEFFEECSKKAFYVSVTLTTSFNEGADPDDIDHGLELFKRPLRNKNPALADLTSFNVQQEDDHAEVTFAGRLDHVLRAFNQFAEDARMSPNLRDLRPVDGEEPIADAKQYAEQEFRKWMIDQITEKPEPKDF